MQRASRLFKSVRAQCYSHSSQFNNDNVLVSIAGAIFNTIDHESIIAFHSAVNRVNTHERHFELRPIVRNVTEWDSFVTEKIGAVPKLDTNRNSR